ncbi:MAG: CHAT domain-containing protein [Ectothiorhodospiraceae bacterium]|nr:CHAT domain-containing protein [Ectothiorhodospiraceae bacterium]
MSAVRTRRPPASPTARAALLGLALWLGPATPVLAAQAGDARVALVHAAALRDQGLLREAAQALDAARRAAAEAGRTDLEVLALSEQADLLLLEARPAAAAAALDAAIALGPQAGDAALAHAYGNRGNLALSRGDPSAAAGSYADAIRHADAAREPAMALRARVNRVRALTAAGDATAAIAAAEDAAARITDASSESVLLGLALADATPAGSSTLRRRLLGDALERARRIDAPRLHALAQGELAAWFEARGDTPEALRRSRAALTLAQSAGATEQVARWHGQVARLLRASGRPAEALAAYRLAVETTRGIRAELGAGRLVRGPAGVLAPMYLELADLLLADRPRDETDTARQARLREARDVVELRKAVEIEDYFRDGCVAELRARTAGIDTLEPRTAVLYAVPLADRLELLVSIGGTIHQVTAPVGGGELETEVHRLRALLERRTDRRYLRPARRIHDWLVAPVQKLLDAADVDTLVMVPNGALHLIPPAALHDGERFLVERYALATTPGLHLTDPGRRPFTDADALLGGVSQAVQDFPPLPAVPRELEGLGALLDARVLADDAFRLPALEQALAARPYRIVHIASHGQFAPDPEDTFLLSYDGRITMDRLQALVGIGEFRPEPLELLTLSACQTAAGDPRAALGLAGVAVKSGARSALATLWSVDDAATADVVLGFYQRLRSGAPSKAAALGAAQRAMLADPRYRHPAYWAPFLLIGNWL